MPIKVLANLSDGLSRKLSVTPKGTFGFILVGDLLLVSRQLDVGKARRYGF